jgi:hypothetical protein
VKKAIKHAADRDQDDAEEKKIKTFIFNAACSFRCHELGPISASRGRLDEVARVRNFNIAFELLDFNATLVIDLSHYRVEQRETRQRTNGKEFSCLRLRLGTEHSTG